jgi:putative addiction module component (TIGR02574 family)
MAILSRESIRDLSPTERMRLIELLWESFVEDPSALPVTDEQRVELRRRLEEHERDPNSAKSWSQVRSELERE